MYTQLMAQAVASLPGRSHRASGHMARAWEPGGTDHRVPHAKHMERLDLRDPEEKWGALPAAHPPTHCTPLPMYRGAEKAQRSKERDTLTEPSHEVAIPANVPGPLPRR